MTRFPKTQELSLYVHFPWCERKCPYCDFATRAAKVEELPLDDYAAGVADEIAWRAEELDHPALVSIFFGGGTPSLMKGEHMQTIVEAAAKHFSCNAEIEVTSECNPNSFSKERALEFRDAGVNRISLGVQSLQDQHLNFLGRLHSGTRALEAVVEAREVFERVSADFIFGMPDHHISQIQSDLEQVLLAGVEHISAYALTIEEKTRFGELHKLGKLRVAQEDQYADLYLAVENTLEQAGFEHYEVSNYAKNKEARSYHNAHYWRYGAYVGVGCAAVGCYHKPTTKKRVRYTNESDAYRYMKAVADKEWRALESEQEVLDENKTAQETIMLGLRTSDGIDAQQRHEELQGLEQVIKKHIEQGELLEQAGRICVPQEKWLTLDSLVLDYF